MANHSTPWKQSPLSKPYTKLMLSSVVLIVGLLWFFSLQGDNLKESNFRLEQDKYLINTENYDLQIKDNQINVIPLGASAATQFTLLNKLNDNQVELHQDLNLKSVYEKIDLRLYEKGENIAYDFKVQLNADVGDIQLKVPDEAIINDSGQLTIPVEGGEIIHSKPYTYQEIDGEKIEVDSRFALAEGILSFEVGAYDKEYELVIDPEIMFLAPCVPTDWNSNKGSITITSTQQNGGNGTINDLLDGQANNTYWFEDGDLTGDDLVKFQFPQPTGLTGFEIEVSGNSIDPGAVVEVQGSNDNSNWTSIQQYTTTSTTSGQFGSSGNVHAFAFPTNTRAYTYYRLFGVSGTTERTFWVYEVYFEAAPTKQSGLSNINCNDNSTTFDTVDDYLSFILDPCGGTGTYTVTASGTTIAAGAGALGASASASFGSPTTFRLGNGSVGAGDVTLTLSGFTDNVDIAEVITDPGSCLDECADLFTDYESGDRRSLITVTVNSTFNVGDPQQLVDGNTDLTGNGVRTSGDITYAAGQEFFKFQLAAPVQYAAFTLFTEGGVFLDNDLFGTMQGSNDGTTWTDLTTPGGLLMDDPQTVYNIPLTQNLAFYSFYRMIGTAGRVDNGEWLSEITATIAPVNIGLSNVQCNTGATTFNESDDFITFDLTPTGVTGNYNLVVAGYTPSPSGGTFGSTTTFTLPAGSVGNGDINITLQNIDNTCFVEGVIPDPGSCIVDCSDLFTVYESGDRRSLITVTVNSTFNVGDPQQLVDGNTDLTGNGVRTSGDITYAAGQEFFRFQLAAPVQYAAFTLFTEGGVFLDNDLFGTMQGSNDGTTWTDLTTPGGLLMDDPQTVYNIPLTQNLAFYSFYRMIGTAGRVDNGEWLSEITATAAPAVAGLSNLVCNASGTPVNGTDDFLSFDLTPEGVTGAYNLVVDGYTPSPSGGTFGTTTTFTLPAGSAGNGDINITIQSTAGACTIEETIIDPGICLPDACGGADWNDPAIKSTIMGMWDIPGTPTNQTEGPIAILVDGDENTGVFSKNNDFMNEPVFDLQFPEATVLTGIEVTATSAPLESGTFIVEASNDGVTYVPLTGNLVFGTDIVSAPSQYGGSSTEAYAFPFASNTTAYTYYRVFAFSMNTAFSFSGRSFDELYFNYQVFDDGLSNVAFGDNGTPGNFDDDIITFDLNPDPGTGTYEVSLAGYTITPTTGTFGQVTSFQTSAGAAGAGDLTVSLYDPTENCLQDIIIPNPDFSGATVAAVQAACASPTDNPLSSIIITADDATFVKAEFNVGAAYAGTGFASATDVTNSSSGFTLVSNLPNPQFDTYYTVRAYNTETLFRDYVVLVQPKVCSVADLQLSISPSTADANEGEQLTYVVTLTNAGPDPAVNVEVRVDIPAGLELLTTSPTIGDYSPGTQLWTSDLVPVGTHQLTVTYRMK